MASALTVIQRQETGSLRMKRMRQGGQVPAILYGGQGGNVLLSVCHIELGKAINSGSRDVQLAGAVAGSASIKAIQWDTFGNQVVHVDFVRV